MKSRQVRIITYRVGVNFGWEAAVKTLRGRVLKTTAVYGFEEAAKRAGEALAQRMGLQVAS